jgi:hypothetical protein
MKIYSYIEIFLSTEKLMNTKGPKQDTPKVLIGSCAFHHKAHEGHEVVATNFFMSFKVFMVKK